MTFALIYIENVTSNYGIVAYYGIIAYYGIVDSLLHHLSFRNWMEIWLFDYNLNSNCVQYNIFSVSGN